MHAGSRRDRPPARRAARGGVLLGFMVGLLAGLSIAVVVAMFITRSPVPFVNKTGRLAERLAEPGSPGETPDPNAPLYAKNRPSVALEPPPPAPTERLSILERLFGRSSGEPEQPRPPSEPPAVKGGPRAADAPSADPRVDAKAGDAADRSSYLLQAGAFRSQQDADAMRAKLALLGFEGRVIPAEVNGQTMYRVRVGPYAQLDDMNRVRSRLAENGIEASVVRQR